MLRRGNAALTASPEEEWEGRGRTLRFLTPFPTDAGFARKPYYWQSRNIISCHSASQSPCNHAGAEAEMLLEGAGVERRL